MPPDFTRSIGVAMKQSEIARLQRKANELEVSRNALAKWCILHALDEIDSGKARPVVRKEVQTRLEMP
jgi:hypothetical protein